MQLPKIAFFFLCPFISSVFSNPLVQDKVQVTIELSSANPSSPDKPDLNPVAPLSYGYNGPGIYYIVSLVDDYAIIPTDYNTLGQTDIILKKLDINDATQRWEVYNSGFGDAVYIQRSGVGWLLANGTADNAFRKWELLPSALWRLNKVPYASEPGKPIRVENVDHCGLVLDQNRDFPIGNGAPVITYSPNKPPSKNQGWKFLQYGQTPDVLDTKRVRFDEM